MKDSNVKLTDDLFNAIENSHIPADQIDWEIDYDGAELTSLKMSYGTVDRFEIYGAGVEDNEEVFILSRAALHGLLESVLLKAEQEETQLDVENILWTDLSKYSRDLLLAQIGRAITDELEGTATIGATPEGVTAIDRGTIAANILQRLSTAADMAIPYGTDE